MSHSTRATYSWTRTSRRPTQGFGRVDGGGEDAFDRTSGQPLVLGPGQAARSPGEDVEHAVTQTLGVAERLERGHLCVRVTSGGEFDQDLDAVQRREAGH